MVADINKIFITMHCEWPSKNNDHHKARPSHLFLSTISNCLLFLVPNAILTTVVLNLGVAKLFGATESSRGDINFCSWLVFTTKLQLWVLPYCSQTKKKFRKHLPHYSLYQKFREDHISYYLCTQVLEKCNYDLNGPLSVLSIFFNLSAFWLPSAFFYYYLMHSFHM